MQRKKSGKQLRYNIKITLHSFSIIDFFFVFVFGGAVVPVHSCDVAGGIRIIAVLSIIIIGCRIVVTIIIAVNLWNNISITRILEF